MTRIRIHWAWLPAAAFFVIVGWIRFGPLATIPAVLVGLALGLFLERRAERRRGTSR